MEITEEIKKHTFSFENNNFEPPKANRNRILNTIQSKPIITRAEIIGKYMKYFKRFEFLALPILRIGLAFVLLWFGFTQLQNPQQWVSFLPGWTSILPITQIQFIYLNGLFEVVGSMLIILGVYTNITALLLSLHLFGIAFSIGLSGVGVRDIGLAIALLALALLGAGKLSIDSLAEDSKIETY